MKTGLQFTEFMYSSLECVSCTGLLTDGFICGIVYLLLRNQGRNDGRQEESNEGGTEKRVGMNKEKRKKEPDK